MADRQYTISATLVHWTLTSVITGIVWLISVSVLQWNDDSKNWAQEREWQKTVDKELAQGSIRVEKLEDEVRRHEIQDNAINFGGRK